jgi:RimJ/RimL family protein N-acetyltransferase
MDPAQYSATETLRDGRNLEIRALKPSDREGLLGAVGRMSAESVYRRFFAPKPRFTDREVDYYLNIDFVNHVALVAVLTENATPTIVGGARYVVSGPGTAEVAFVVDDAHQGLGIGGLLMKHLAAIASRSGLHTLVAEVLANNTAMLKVFERSGLPMSTAREQGIARVVLSLS